MNMKKVYAALTATACISSTMLTMPQFAAPVYASESVHNDFEVTYDGWYGNSDTVELIAEDAQGFDGSRGMVVSNRKSAEEGAASSKGFYLEGGVKYEYGIKVYSETDQNFRVSLLYKDEATDEETVVELISQEVKGGEWTELKASYKAPKNTYEYLVTVTNDSTEDFKFDDFSVKSKGNKMTAKAIPSGKGLKDEFGDYFRVGNIFNGTTINNSSITATILKDCNAVECENETKPDATIVQNGSTDTNVKVSLSRCAAIADFCVKNNLAFRGHTLVWHSQTPEWFFKTGFNNNGSYVDSATMDKRMESYIKNMFAAFKTQYPTLNLYAYDVCNEVINDGTAGNGGVRPTNGTNGQNGSSAWVRVYGNNSFVEKAFTYAKKYAPSTCKLYYNDYNEFADPKKKCIQDTIIKPLAAKGLLDGMGMQSHIDCSTGQYDWGNTTSYLNAIDEYLSLGIDVQITELDISRDGGKYTDQQQADKYKAIFKHCKEVNESGKYKGKVTLVQVWGPNDANSWVATNNSGQKNYPLLYNEQNQPKTAYSAVASIIPDSQWSIGMPYHGPGSDGSSSITKPEPNDYGWWFQCGFENGEDDWTGRGSAKVASSGATDAYVGSKSLYVSGRESAWNGATFSLPYTFEAGTAYSFSANVKHTTGDDTVKYMMKIQYKGSDNETYYDEVASGVAPKGEWLQLANTSYTLPKDASDIQLYIETEDTTNDFYVDEVIGAVDGTGILGAGQPSVRTLLRGDVDCDGAITALDLAAARKGIVSGKFDDDTAKKAADVDQSGKAEENDLILLSEYLLGKIESFPKAEVKVDTAAMEALFKNVSVGSSYKKEGENNPLYTQRFGADPGWMVYDGRLYVFTTDDQYEYKNGQVIRNDAYNSGTINCVSSADLVNWTDHGAIPVAARNNRTTGGVASWASCAWAPDACHKKINGKDKFFLYFANSGGGIGVLTADSPLGPWKDPIGGPLVSHNSPNCSDVVWMFDPGVYYDEETDEAYLFFGGGVDNRDKSNPKTGRVVKLGKDMISLDGTPQTMETPYLFEDSSIIKIGDTWYYSFCANWNVPGGTSYNGQSFGNADICYLTSKNPLGPWTKSQFGGMAFANTFSQGLDNGGNNHHSIVEFKGKYYVLYHTRQLDIRKLNKADKSDLNYRSPSINEATFSNGKITCKGSHAGVSQLESLDAYKTVQAETMSNQSTGISVSGVGDTTVSMKKGDWIKVSGVNLKNGVDSITVKGAAKSGGAIKFCVGSPTGDVIGYAELGSSSAETTVSAVSSPTGTKDIYIVASNDNIELDYWYFS